MAVNDTASRSVCTTGSSREANWLALTASHVNLELGIWVFSDHSEEKWQAPHHLPDAANGGATRKLAEMYRRARCSGGHGRNAASPATGFEKREHLKQAAIQATQGNGI